MKQIDSPHKDKQDSGWQLLGGINLSVSSEVDFPITPWLTELLGPLDLSIDFLNRVLESVQDSVARAIHSNVANPFGHINLSVFAPHEPISIRKTWGFFHIERIESRDDSVDAREHAIDFYLYVEGQ